MKVLSMQMHIMAKADNIIQAKHLNMKGNLSTICFRERENFIERMGVLFMKEIFLMD